MAVSLLPYGSSSPNDAYIAWSPVPLVIKNTPDGTSGTLRISSTSAPGSVAKAVFLTRLDQAPESELNIQLQAGEEKSIFIAGDFQPGEPHNGASADGKDVIVQAHWVEDPAAPPATVNVMIRVRRNANELSPKAREDFLFALAKLNGIQVDADITPGPGRGIYVEDFVALHVAGADLSQHRDSHFLPWHRLYLLDLERQLQLIRPAVTLPYWRFDLPAPNLFTENFIGATRQIPRDTAEPGGEFDGGGFNTPLAGFAVDNPLSRWQIRDVRGIPRTARFDTQNEAAQGVDGLPDPGDTFPLLTQDATLRLGGGFPDPEDAKLGNLSTAMSFARLEGTPHGAAHVSFNGRLNTVSVAPQDPLFFLLHCNVDRLWAVWQNLFGRDNQNDPRTYPYQQPGDAQPWEIINAQQWPWDGGLSKPGNLLPPGSRQENFTRSRTALNFLNNVPKLENAIDLLAHHDENNFLGFGYDDVPYDHVDLDVG